MSTQPAFFIKIKIKVEKIFLSICRISNATLNERNSREKSPLISRELDRYYKTERRWVQFFANLLFSLKRI
jgi:hypothetical protein